MNPFDRLNNQADAIDINKWLAEQRALQQPKQTTKKGKGFWLDQISTGGGIGGALAGGAAGAALGSAVPVVGTAIGGLAGAILGGALGSGGGEIAENFITDEEDKLRNVGKEALLGGVTSLPVGAGLKVAQAGLKAATGIGKTGTRELLEQAGAGTIGTKAAASSSSPNFGRKLADKMFAQAFTLPRRAASSLKPEKTARELLDYGISGSLDNINKISSDVLKNMGQIVDKSVSSIGGQVRVGDITSIADNALKGVKITGPEKQALMERVTNIGTEGALPGYSNASQLLEQIRELERYGYNRINAATSGLVKNPDLEDIGSAYIQVAKELEDNLYNAINKSGSLKALQTPEMAAKLNTVVKGLGDKFLRSKDAGEVRSLMAPFVRARNLISTTLDESSSAGSQGLAGIAGRGAGTGIGALAGGLPGAAAGFLAAPLLRGAEEAVRSPIATTVARGIDNVSTNLTRQNPGRGIVPLAAREAGGRYITGNDLGSSQPGTLEDVLMQQPSQQAPGQQAPGSLDQQYSQSPYTRENLLFDIQRDPANTEKYLEYFATLQKALPSSQTDLTASQQKTAVTAQNALNDVSVLADAIESGSLNRNLIPFSDNPLVGNALGVNNLNAALYNIGDVILRSRTGAAAPKEEVEKFIAGYLPRAGESRETQLYKLQRALSELQGMVNPPAALGSGSAPSLEDVLMQHQ